MAGAGLILLSSAPAAGEAEGKVIVRSSFWKGFTAERDGKIYRSGVFHSDIQMAFQGNPKASREAAIFSSERRTSAWLMLIGGLTWVGGFAWGISRGLDDPIYLSVAGPGAAIGVAGQFLRAHATTHLLNAVNLFNFGVGEKTSRGPGDFGGRMRAAERAPTFSLAFHRSF